MSLFIVHSAPAPKRAKHPSLIAEWTIVGQLPAVRALRIASAAAPLNSPVKTGAQINDATTLWDICPSTTHDDNSERLEPHGISSDDEVMETRWNDPGMVMSLVGGLADRQGVQRISAILTTSRARYARCVAGAT